jgi:hypothetical protein
VEKYMKRPTIKTSLWEGYFYASVFCTNAVSPVPERWQKITLVSGIAFYGTRTFSHANALSATRNRSPDFRNRFKKTIETIMSMQRKMPRLYLRKSEHLSHR